MPKHPAPRNAEGGRPKAQNHNLQVHLERTEIHTSPLPPPEALAKYEEIIPGFAERLMRLTEEEAAHRRQVTSQAQRNTARETMIGQVFALIVSLVAFATAAWLGYLDHPAAAATVGSTTIAVLAGVFIAGRRG